MARRLLLFAAAATAAAAAWTNFTSTCTDAVLHESRTGHLSLLTASCRVDAAGDAASTPPATHRSTLDLNLCLGINYTTADLAWSVYGKFSEYCARCHVVGRTRLGCACATLSGVRANSTIDLGA